MPEAASIPIYLNSPAIGALVATIMAGLIGSFMLTIEFESRATRYLAVTFVATALFNFFYIAASAVLHPMAALHRWGTVSMVMVVIALIISYVFHHGSRSWPRAAKVLTGLCLVVALIATAAFVHGTVGKSPQFDFTGHYWDFEVRFLNVAVAAAIAAMTLLFVASVIVRLPALPRPERAGLAGIGFSFLVASAVPSVTNVLSRNGQFDRGLHQGIAVILFVVGLFLIIIIYINTTNDRTTFMTKIVGVSVVTFLLLFQFISFFVLQDLERQYDADRARDVRLYLAGRPPRTQPRYIDQRDFARSSASFSGVSAASDRPSPRDWEAESRNTLLLERIRAAALPIREGGAAR